MKILFICGAGIFSGKEKVTLTLMNALRAQGNEIMCLTAVWGNGQFASLLKEQGFAYKRTRLGFISLTLSFFAIKCTLHQLIYIPKLWFDYKRFVKKHKPEIIVHCNFQHLLLLYPVLNQKQKHYYHSHETISCTKQYKWLFNLFDKKIVKFIGVSNFVASSLINVGLSPGKVTFIHNGLEKIKNVPKTHSTIITIGIAGQIGRWKGHEDLFEALAILKESNIDFNCLIFGSGNEKYVKFLKEKAIYLKIEKNIAWKGFTLAQEEIYKKIDVLCDPAEATIHCQQQLLKPGFMQYR